MAQFFKIDHVNRRQSSLITNQLRITHFADVAQLAEQLICNQQVIGSSPIIGFDDLFIYGWIPEWPKGTDCKSAATCFGGSNPPPPIKKLNSDYTLIS